MHGGILETIVGAIFFGILAQVLACRYKLPAILPLLLFGMAVGPFGRRLEAAAGPGAALATVRHQSEDPAAAVSGTEAGGTPAADPA